MKKVILILIFFILLISGCSENNITLLEKTNSNENSSIYPFHEPYGEGIGIFPGRVVWSYDPEAVGWDGNGFWWNESNFNIQRIKNLISISLNSLTGENSESKSWEKLFEFYNETYNKEGSYKENQKIAIKVNINGSGVFDDDTSGETNLSYTNPYLLKYLLLSLVIEGGVKPENIYVYDVSRIFPKYMVSLCSKDSLKGIHFIGRKEAKSDKTQPLNFSYNFNSPQSFLPTVVTEADYLINLANLKGHSYGITLTAKNHFGSFLNSSKINPTMEANLHQWLTKNEMDLYSPLVDLITNENLGGKTVLYILDGLIVAPGEGIEMTKENTKWEMEPFGNNYTSSIFMSQDPIAIDSVGADFLVAEPNLGNINPAVLDPTNENYLHEAGLVKNSPSGTEYKNVNGKVNNLGVHEHWNNPTDKQYSRNLGKNYGIELVFNNLTNKSD